MKRESCLLLLSLLISAAVCQAAQYEHPKSLLNVAALSIALEPGVTLSVSSSEFSVNGQQVTVTWSGVAQPDQLDAVALYVPGTAQPAYSTPVN
ncbi:uncharacterized protein HaLaN_32574, partial [Haematococcus lacustris]